MVFITFEIVIIIIISLLFVLIAVFQLKALKSRKEILVQDIHRLINVLVNMSSYRLIDNMHQSQFDSNKILRYLDNEEIFKRTKDISFEEEEEQQEFLNFIKHLKSFSKVEREQTGISINQYREMRKYQKYRADPLLLNDLDLKKLENMKHELNTINTVYGSQQLFSRESETHGSQQKNSLSTYTSSSSDQNDRKKFSTSE